MSFMSDLTRSVETICNSKKVAVQNDTTVVVVSKFWTEHDLSSREEWLRVQLNSPTIYSPYFDIEKKRFVCLTPDDLEYSEVGQAYKVLFA